MKILHCILHIGLCGGGPSRSLPLLCNNQAKNNNVYLMCYNIKSPNADIVDPSVNLRLIDGNSMSIAHSDFTKEIKSVSPDIIQLHNLWSWLYHMVCVYARKNGIPYIISPRGTLEPWSIRHKALKKKIAMLLYQRKDLTKAVCIHATAEKEAYNIRLLGIKTPIAVIPNGIDLINYNLRNLTQKTKSKYKMLYVSRMHPKKGVDILINAYNKLSPAIKSNWSLDIVYSDDDNVYLKKIQTLIKQHNLSDNISLVGAIFGNDLIAKYRDSDLFILPTYSENFGMVVGEALACGIPVITTTGAPWQGLVANRCGWWIDLSVENLTNAMISATSLSHKERIEMGLRGRKMIENEYSLKSIAMKFDILYKWLNNGGDRPEFIY